MKRSVKQWCGVGCAVWLSAACGDDAENGGIGNSAGAAYAVTLSDYASSGVALLDEAGDVVDARYISSGSALPGLSAALHSDIGLPTTPCGADALTIVARYGGDYVLQVDFETNSVRHQVATQTATSAGAYQSNPQDILCLDDQQALVSRLEPNFTPKPPAIDRGSDLVLVDLEKEELSKSLDLSALHQKVTVVDKDGKESEQLAYARPGNILRRGEHALVGLSRLTADFSTGGDGMVAVVALDALTVKGLEIPGLKNCGSLTPVVGRDDAAIVSCAGSPYGDAASAGLAFVAVDEDGKAEVEHVYQADAELGMLYASPVSLGGTRALVVWQDANFEMPKADRVYVVDLAERGAEQLFEAENAGDIGSGWNAADGSLLLLPDAAVGVRRFEVDGKELTEAEPIELEATLPARSVRSL